MENDMFRQVLLARTHSTWRGPRFAPRDVGLAEWTRCPGALASGVEKLQCRAGGEAGPSVAEPGQLSHRPRGSLEATPGGSEQHGKPFKWTWKWRIVVRAGAGAGVRRPLLGRSGLVGAAEWSGTGSGSGAGARAGRNQRQRWVGGPLGAARTKTRGRGGSRAPTSDDRRRRAIYRLGGNEEKRASADACPLPL